MSDVESKEITIFVKDLSFKSDQHVVDLIRYLAEALPQINLDRDGNELSVLLPINLSKRALKLRIKKFLYKKDYIMILDPFHINLLIRMDIQ